MTPSSKRPENTGREPVSVLTVGGSDCSGGGGIGIDTRVISAWGLHPAAAVTAVTVQNRKSFTSANPLAPELVRAQIDAVCDDLFPGAVKIGMLANASIVSATARAIKERKLTNVVLDPVLVSSSGGRLLEESAIETLKTEIFSLCDIITPNLPEAELLTGMSLTTPENIRTAAQMLRQTGAGCVIIKGGHAEGPTSGDLVCFEDQFFTLEADRVEGARLRGTGCLFASAVAASLCSPGDSALPERLQRAKDFVTRVIRYSHEKSPSGGLLSFPPDISG